MTKHQISIIYYYNNYTVLYGSDNINSGAIYNGVPMTVAAYSVEDPNFLVTPKSPNLITL